VNRYSVLVIAAIPNLLFLLDWKLRRMWLGNEGAWGEERRKRKEI
jgi:hypothetical protein